MRLVARGEVWCFADPAGSAVLFLIGVDHQQNGKRAIGTGVYAGQMNLGATSNHR
jgi:hypothetical protein